MSNVFSRFEDSVENAMDAAAGTVFKAPIEPAQVAKKAEKQMRHNRLVGAGRQYAPTLYNVLVSPGDNARLFGFYPTMAAEIETYLMAKGSHAGLDFDGRPLVRFIVDESLRKGKFDVIAENVTASVIRRLRDEEMEYYGLTPEPASPRPAGRRPQAARQDSFEPAGQRQRPPQAAGPQRNAPQRNTSQQGSFQQDTPAAFGRAALPELPSLVPNYDREAAASAFAAQSFGSDLNEEEAAPLPSKGNASLVDLRDHTIYQLDIRSMSIGRGADNDIVLHDANASRTHAQLTQDVTGTWKLVDLNSTNGTQLNDRPVSQAFLSAGDHISIGLTTLEFNI